MAVRFLAAGDLVVLEPGLWVVDRLQPVAAVLDLAAGELRHLVSWAEVPPPPVGDGWPGRRVIGDGSSLWAKEDGRSLLVRVSVDGIASATWVDDLRLWATHPGVAWCADGPPRQVLVQGADAVPGPGLNWSRLLRVDADGTTTTVRVKHPIRSVHAVPDALLVEVDDEPWRLRPLGVNSFEVVRATGWLRLPVDADLPDSMSLQSHGIPAPEIEPRESQPGHPIFHRFDYEAERAARAWAAQWSLDDGTLLGVVSTGGRPVVTVIRRRAVTGGPAALVDVLALEEPPDVTVLLAADQVDISRHCWRLVPRPQDADSYARQMLDRHRHVDQPWLDEVAAGRSRQPEMRDLQTRLVGEWPDTVLEWIFSWQPLPGLTLRRRIRLFDELGRIHPLEYEEVYLDETLRGGGLPPVACAVDGILDI